LASWRSGKSYHFRDRHNLHEIEAFWNHLAINTMTTPAPLGPPLEEAIYADTKAV
jgi:hypothetical protein